LDIALLSCPGAQTAHLLTAFRHYDGKDVRIVRSSFRI
jgi:hypothetical protein